MRKPNRTRTRARDAALESLPASFVHLLRQATGKAELPEDTAHFFAQIDPGQRLNVLQALGALNQLELVFLDADTARKLREVEEAADIPPGGALDTIAGGAVDSWEEPSLGVLQNFVSEAWIYPEGPEVALEKCAILQAKWQREREVEKEAQSR
jgi:hypothetical protein